MELNANSISAKLYRWFYNTEIMPSNLCPYFWKLVIMYIFIIPYTILSFPSTIKYEKGFYFEHYPNKSRFTESVVGLLMYTFIIASILLLLSPIYSLSWFFMNEAYIKAHSSVYDYSFILSFILFIMLIIYVWEAYIDGKINYLFNKSKINKRKHNNIIKEFIKAKYHKYCPKIDWK